MNMKDLEALVLEQGRHIQELQAHYVDQARGIVQLQEAMTDMKDALAGVYETCQQVSGDVRRLEEWIGAGDADGPFYAEFVALKDKLEDIAAKVEGRNKSAAVKRNMTDLDALEVLTGKYKDLGHKEAAEQIGLTYAQIYSCRLCFTFKHVHHGLEKGGWKNQWAKA